ncbi:unnamed protein product [Didymodactylos carnosus]|uniref:Uncharacterized protein n=1 Tax=Didymodactylos carnosus TaxID=1234261 RepID=A0A814TES1_9BILA|nr:unnamed protein product [Didymodactylos carnosus]CAF1158566.1 unnamed protein product [Didymodactylos carnosus]CAF3596229.1 unnamed protein product [Didymodactylos carnosus]CAF3921995.1 unnamed protein product [Didymodactylos carnosus]
MLMNDTNLKNVIGEYLASKTTTVRPKAVGFKHTPVQNDVLIIGNLPLKLYDDQATVDICGTVAHASQVSTVKKFDQVSQKRLPVAQQTFVVADMTGAVIVYAWGNLAGNVSNVDLE